MSRELDEKEVRSLLYSSDDPMGYAMIQEAAMVRCDHIVRMIAEMHGMEVEWWDFSNAPLNLEDGRGVFDITIYRTMVGFVGDFRKMGSKTKRHYQFEFKKYCPNIFPTSWLWTNEKIWKTKAESMIVRQVSAQRMNDGQKNRRDRIIQMKDYARKRIVDKLNSMERQTILFK